MILKGVAAKSCHAFFTGMTGTEDQGFNFAEQFSRLDTIDPEFLFITGWNEWVAQRRVFTGSGG